MLILSLFSFLVVGFVLMGLFMNYSFFIILSLSVSFICYLIDLNLGFSFVLDSPLTFFDEVSFLLSYISVFVIVSCWVLFFSNSLNYSSFLSLYSLLVFCILVFSSGNLVLLYFFFECSIFPIVYIILNWGTYPDRGLSCLIILIFTSVFTFPFMVLILVVFKEYLSTHFLLLSINIDFPLPFFAVVWIFLSFAVNLPIYGLHFWLPMAHVEAPTFGSIILAGLLLKLGGCGLLRIVFLIVPHLSSFVSLFLSYVIFCIIFSSLVCCVQADFKRLVAYSSVVHISCIPILLFVASPLSLNALLILIVFHGLSSPLMFFFVGLVYNIYNSRLFIVVRGLIVVSPLIGFLVLVLFLISIPTPPFPPFLSEVLIFISCISLSLYLSLGVFLILFISLLYNLFWFTSVCFVSPSYVNSSYHFSFLNFFMFFLYLLVVFLFIFFVFLF